MSASATNTAVAQKLRFCYMNVCVYVCTKLSVFRRLRERENQRLLNKKTGLRNYDSVADSLNGESTV